MGAPGLSYTSAPGRRVLAVSVLGSGIAALDATVVNIALPVIGRDFGTGVAAPFRPAHRARAIGAWSGLGGIAVAAGPLAGGYLIAAASWRWIFFINLPIAVIVIVLSSRHVPESRDPDAGGRTDYLGAAAVVVFLTGITFAFTEAPALGWSSPAVLTMALVGVTGLAVFLTWERHAASPMLPLAIFAQRHFAAVNTVAFIVYAALTGATFLLPVMLQVVSGYSPLGSGLALLPLTIIMLVLSGRSGQLAARIGLAPSGPSYARYVLAAVVVFGPGLAITVAPLTATAVTITNPAREHPAAATPEQCLHGGLDAPPLTASLPRG